MKLIQVFMMFPKSPVTQSVLISAVIALVIGCGVYLLAAAKGRNAEVMALNTQAQMQQMENGEAQRPEMGVGIQDTRIISLQASLQSLEETVAQLQTRGAVNVSSSTTQVATQKTGITVDQFNDVVNIACLGLISEDQPGLSESDVQLKASLLKKYCTRFAY